MAITSATFHSLNYSNSARKYSVKLECVVGEGKTSFYESASVWDNSGDAAEAGLRAVNYLAENGVLPDMSKKW